MALPSACSQRHNRPKSGDTLAYWLDITGSLWLNGLRMTVVPLVVALLVTGIVKSAEAARAGPMAARTVTWIVAMMVLSAAMGAILTPIVPDDLADARKKAPKRCVQR